MSFDSNQKIIEPWGLAEFSKKISSNTCSISRFKQPKAKNLEDSKEYQAGLQKGLELAKIEHDRKFNALNNSLNELTNNLANLTFTYENDLKTNFYNLAQKLLYAVLQIEMSHNKDKLLQVLSKAIDNFKSSHIFKILVSKTLYEAIKEYNLKLPAESIEVCDNLSDYKFVIQDSSQKCEFDPDSFIKELFSNA